MKLIFVLLDVLLLVLVVACTPPKPAETPKTDMKREMQ